MSQQIQYSVRLGDISDQLKSCQSMIMSCGGSLLLEEESRVEIFRALESLKETIADSIVTRESEASEANNNTAHRAIVKITERETEVLQLLARGCSYAETADYLGCKLSTIQTHIKNIYDKMGVHSRAEAVHEAFQLGLVVL